MASKIHTAFRARSTKRTGTQVGQRKDAISSGVLLRRLRYVDKSLTEAVTKPIGAGVDGPESPSEAQQKKHETVVRFRLLEIAQDAQRSMYKYKYEKRDLYYLVVPLVCMLAFLAILTALTNISWFYVIYLCLFALMTLSIPCYLFTSFFSVYYSTWIPQGVGFVMSVTNLGLLVTWFVFSLPYGELSGTALWLRLFVAFFMIACVVLSCGMVWAGVGMEHAYLIYACTWTASTNLGRLVLTAAGKGGEPYHKNTEEGGASKIIKDQ